MLQVVALTWDALVYASAVAPLLGPGVFQPLEHGRGFGTRAEKKRAGGAAVCGAQADAQRGRHPCCRRTSRASAPLMAPRWRDAGVAIFACRRGAQTGAGCSGSVASSPLWPRAKLLRLVVGTAVDQTAVLQAQLWTCQLHHGHNYKLDHSAVEPTVHLAALLWNTSR